MRVKNSLFLTLFVLVGFMNATPMWAGDCVPPPPGLVSWWPGDGNANDIVGPNNGILRGGVTFEKGMVGEAFNFADLGSYVEASSAGFPIGINPRTIEMWVRIDSFVPGIQAAATFAVYGTPGSLNRAFWLGALPLEGYDGSKRAAGSDGAPWPQQYDPACLERHLGEFAESPVRPAKSRGASVKPVPTSASASIKRSSAA